MIKIIEYGSLGWSTALRVKSSVWDFWPIWWILFVAKIFIDLFELYEIRQPKSTQSQIVNHISRNTRSVKMFEGCNGISANPYGKTSSMGTQWRLPIRCLFLRVTEQTYLARNVAAALTSSLLWHFCRGCNPKILTWFYDVKYGAGSVLFNHSGYTKVVIVFI